MVEAHEYTRARARRAASSAATARAVTITARGRDRARASSRTIAVPAHPALARRCRATTVHERCSRSRAAPSCSPATRSRALAYLYDAHRRGDDTPALRFLLATALRDVSAEGDARLRRRRPLPRVRARTGATSPRPATTSRRCGTSSDREPRRDARHGRQVRAGSTRVGYSHDGKTLATWGQDGVAAPVGCRRRACCARESKHGARTSRSRRSRPTTRGSSRPASTASRACGTRATVTLIRAIEASTSFIHHLYGVLSPDGTRLLTVTIDRRGPRLGRRDRRRSSAAVEHGAFVVGGELAPDGTARRHVRDGSPRQGVGRRHRRARADARRGTPTSCGSARSAPTANAC